MLTCNNNIIHILSLGAKNVQIFLMFCLLVRKLVNHQKIFMMKNKYLEALYISFFQHHLFLEKTDAMLEMLCKRMMIALAPIHLTSSLSNIFSIFRLQL